MMLSAAISFRSRQRTRSNETGDHRHPEPLLHHEDVLAAHLPFILCAHRLRDLAHALRAPLPLLGPTPAALQRTQCPNCNNALTNRGRIRSGPIQIYDPREAFYVIGCEYVCTNDVCRQASGAGPDGLKFASTDASILRALPVKLKDEFPAHLVLGVPGVPTRTAGDLGSSPSVWNWQAVGVSTALWNMVRGCLAANVSREGILSILKGIYEGLPEEEEQSPSMELPDPISAPAAFAHSFTGAAGLQILQSPAPPPAANGSTSASASTPTAPVASSSAGKVRIDFIPYPM